MTLIDQQIEFQILDRKTYKPLPNGILSGGQVNYFEATKHFIGVGTGRMDLNGAGIPRNVLASLVDGSGMIRLYRQYKNNVGEIKTEDYMGIVDKVIVQFSADNYILYNVGNIKNFMTVLGAGASTAGRTPNRLLIEDLVRSAGVNERRIDERQSAFSASSLVRGISEINQEKRRRREPSVNFNGGGNVSPTIIVYFHDPLKYFDRRLIRSDGVNYTYYGGATCSEFITKLIENEVLKQSGSRPALDAPIRIVDPQIGQFSGMVETWANLGKTIRDAQESAQIGIRIRLEAGVMVLEYYTGRSRSSGKDRVVLNQLFGPEDLDVELGDRVRFEGWIDGHSEPYDVVDDIPVASKRITVSENGQIDIRHKLGQRIMSSDDYINKTQQRTTNTEAVI